MKREKALEDQKIPLGRRRGNYLTWNVSYRSRCPLRMLVSLSAGEPAARGAHCPDAMRTPSPSDGHTAPSSRSGSFQFGSRS